MIRVCIADDHDIVRSGLRHLLATDPEIRVCDEMPTASGLLERARQKHWDVLVLDINLPGNPVPSWCARSRNSNPHLPW